MSFHRFPDFVTASASWAFATSAHFCLGNFMFDLSKVTSIYVTFGGQFGKRGGRCSSVINTLGALPTTDTTTTRPAGGRNPPQKATWPQFDSYIQLFGNLRREGCTAATTAGETKVVTLCHYGVSG